MIADLQRLTMQVSEAVILAETCDVGFGFVIAGDHVGNSGTAGEDLADTLEPLCPTHHVAGGEVVIGFYVDEAFEGFEI